MSKRYKAIYTSISIVYILLNLTIVTFIVVNKDLLLHFVFIGDYSKSIGLILYFPIIALFILCVKTWYKKDKRPINLLLLILLMSIYSPLYYFYALKKRWIWN